MTGEADLNNFLQHTHMRLIFSFFQGIPFRLPFHSCLKNVVKLAVVFASMIFCLLPCVHAINLYSHIQSTLLIQNADEKPKPPPPDEDGKRKGI